MQKTGQKRLVQSHVRLPSILNKKAAQLQKILFRQLYIFRGQWRPFSVVRSGGLLEGDYYPVSSLIYSLPATNFNNAQVTSLCTKLKDKFWFVNKKINYITHGSLKTGEVFI